MVTKWDPSTASPHVLAWLAVTHADGVAHRARMRAYAAGFAAAFLIAFALAYLAAS